MRGIGEERPERWLVGAVRLAAHAYGHTQARHAAAVEEIAQFLNRPAHTLLRRLFGNAQRLTDLRSRLVTARRNVKTSDSTRAARQQPLGRPLSDFAGRYADSAYGNVELSMRNGRLEYRWGALFGPVEVFDAARNQLRIQFAGNGTVLSFDFPGQGPARSLQLQGVTFSRTP